MGNLSPKVAVAGAGYWGKNLVRNFHQLGSLAWVCDEEKTPCRRHVPSTEYGPQATSRKC